MNKQLQMGRMVNLILGIMYIYGLRTRDLGYVQAVFCELMLSILCHPMIC